MHKIHPKHLQEWNESGVPEHITNLNVTSYMDDQGNYGALDRLLYGLPKKFRGNTGRPQPYYLKKYDHVKNGGWHCSGGESLLEPGTQNEFWGTFKPETPRVTIDEKGREKTLKYENPVKVRTEIFALKTTKQHAEKILKPYGYNKKNKKETFWSFVLRKADVPIYLTEGAKKAGCLMDKVAALGLSGIYNGYRRNELGERTLIPELEAIAVPGRPIYIVFDEDEKESAKLNTFIASRQLELLLKEKGCIVTVVRWHSSLGKGCDDLVVNHGWKALEQAIEFSLDDRGPQSEQNGLTLRLFDHESLGYTPNEERDSEYLGKVAFETMNKLVCIRSPKGTGKTTSIKPYIEYLLAQGKRVIITGHRTNLLRSLAGLFGVVYIDDISKISELTNCQCIALCVNSLHSKSKAFFEPTEWKGSHIVIDEATQVLKHMFTCGTCKKYRPAILKSFKYICNHAEKIVAADADLNTNTVKYLSRVSKSSPYIINNKYAFQNKKWNVYNVAKPEQLLAAAYKSIEKGENVMICLSGQKSNSLWGTQTVERYIKGKFPEIAPYVLRYDSESVADPEHPAYGTTSVLNDTLRKVKVFITSPTLGTGVDLHLKNHFSKVFGIFLGVLEPSSVRQFLARVREPVDRWICLSKTGHNWMAGGATNEQQLLKNTNKAVQAQIKMLQKMGIPEIDEAENLDDLTPDTVDLDCWAEMVISHNLGMKDYSANVLEGLAREGHNVIDMSDYDVEVDKGEVRQIRSENYEQHKKEVVEVHPLETEEQFRQLDGKNAKTKMERNQWKNWKLSVSYGAVTPEVIETDDKNLYGKLKTLFYLTEGQEYVQQDDINSATFQFQNGDGEIWTPDFMKTQKAGLIKVLKYFKLDGLIEEGKPYCNSTEELIDFRRQFTPQVMKDIACLGVTGLKTKDTPIQLFKKVLSFLGIKLQSTKKRVKAKNGKREYLYEIKKPVVLSQVFTYWKEKAEQRKLAIEEKERRRLEDKAGSVYDQLPPNPVSDIAAGIICKLEDLIGSTKLLEEVKSLVRSEDWEKWGDQIFMNAAPAVRYLILAHAPL
ncbi:plasmid replication protein, CyRepA1 family [Moorena sp. SIO3A2]|uniref:plasmid replication protein, CyRepA1 family n=1 Tax=Moorena sp. SIO3A2 TaxID=2607841 RepID=UPI0013BA9B2F|nr:plasmid replication protein, CyRepA1 family [Moorena sp. SIO3A2]NER90362.1 DUF3854 domain-containing protein [Moorena sp. SIO3A2]